MDNVEMKAMRATIRDGITEQLLGAMLLLFGLVFSLAPPLGFLCALFPLVLIPLGSFLKRRFVYPRVGYAKVARQPHAVRGLVIASVVFVVAVLGALGVFSLLLGFDRGSSLWLSHFVPALGGLFLAIGPWTVATTYRLLRWYIFAALFVLGGICLPLLHIATGYEAVSLESAIVGGLALIYGIGLFLTFLRKYPREELSHAAE
jgi:hypothetical protein